MSGPATGRSEKTCLIVKIGALGDVAQTIPAARALATQGYRVHWLCGTSVLPLIECYSWIQPVPVDDRRLLKSGGLSAVAELLAIWQRTIGRRCDLCAVLHYDIRYRALALAVRATRTVVLSMGDRRRQLIPGRNRADEYLRIVTNRADEARADGAVPMPPDRLPQNSVPHAVSRRLVALAPGGARNLVRDDPLRRWPLENYVALAHELDRRGWQVVLTGGRDDAWVSAAFAGLNVEDRIGTLTIPELLALYAACDLVVTHDTGPVHLAGLVGCRLIGLFGPTMPATVMPRRDGVAAIWGGGDLACRPCYDGRDYAPCSSNRCLQSVAVEHVLVQIDAMFRRGSAMPGAKPLRSVSIASGS